MITSLMFTEVKYINSELAQGNDRNQKKGCGKSELKTLVWRYNISLTQ